MDPNAILGAVASPQDDQSALLAQVQAYANFLAQQKAQQNQMGANPAILGAQVDVDRARAQAASAIMAQPTPTVQNWEDDPKNHGNQQYAALLAQGPPQLQQFMNGPNAAAMQQASLNQYNQQLANSKISGQINTKMLSPDEVLAKQNTIMSDKVGQAQGLLDGAKPQTLYDPDTLMKMSMLAGKALEGSQAQRQEALKGLATLGASANQASGQVQSAALQAQGQVGAAEAQASGVRDAANAKASGSKQLTPAVRTALQTTITGLQNSSATLNTLAKGFNDKYFTTLGRGELGIKEWASKKGLSTEVMDQELADYSSFKKNTRQMFNEYRKAITGAAASEKELKMLEESIFNVSGNDGPAAAKMALVELMADMQMKTALASKTMEIGVSNGSVDLEPGTEKFGRYIDAMAANQNNAKIREMYKINIMKQYPQLAVGTLAKEAGLTGQPQAPAMPNQAAAIAALKARGIQLPQGQ